MRFARMLVLVLLCFVVIGGANAQEPVGVVTSFSILGDVIVRITEGADNVSVFALIPVGGDPHSFEPAPRDLAILDGADVVFVVGANFEEGVMEAIENAAPDLRIETVSSCIEMLAFGQHAHDEPMGEDEHAGPGENVDAAMAALCESHREELHDSHDSHDAEHEGEADHGHGTDEVLGPLYTLECGGHGHEEESGEAHDHGECDPHVWSDPHNVRYWALYVRDTMIAIDPANAELYTENARAYIAELEALVHDFIEPAVATIPVENRVLLTNHETLNYFAYAYGFEVIGTVIPNASTAAEPSAAQFAALLETVRDEGITAVFAENTLGTRLAEQLAAEAGVQFYTLYTDSLSFPDEDGFTYTDYIRANVRTIVTALGGTLE